MVLIVNEVVKSLKGKLRTARARDLLHVESFSTSELKALKELKQKIPVINLQFVHGCIYSYAGLPCKEVTGHAKSVGYEPGMKIPEEKFTNTWNVVLIMGDWWPVQCNWGAR